MLRPAPLLLVWLLGAGCAEIAPPGEEATGAGSDMRGAGGCGTCTGKTPVCDPKTQRCVGCLVDGNCPGGTVCRMQACVPGCSAQRACQMGICDVDAGVCGGCRTDAECKDPRAPVCDASRCVPCTPAKDRCPAGSYCA